MKSIDTKRTFWLAVFFSGVFLTLTNLPVILLLIFHVISNDNHPGFSSLIWAALVLPWLIWVTCFTIKQRHVIQEQLAFPRYCITIGLFWSFVFFQIWFHFQWPEFIAV